MKVSIITLHNVSNYGSALQTYATQKVFENLECKAEFVDYCRPNNTIYSSVERILNSRKFKKYKKVWNMNKLAYNLAYHIIKFYLLHKKNPITDFVKSNVNLTPNMYYSVEELKNNPPQADVYVTGSDQVWNSIWNNGIDTAFFLEYAPANKRRIAFSSSIGRTTLDEEEVIITKQLLRKYDFISIRERSGVELLDKMGIKSVEILDPTLMIDGDRWRSVAEYKNINSEDYLLIYQLNPNVYMDEYAKKLANLKEWKIIRIGYSPSDKKRIGKCVMKPSVPRFLGYINNAKCVLTDSFHATAFSLNLGVDFITVLPPKFHTRIDNILSLTKTKHRLLKDYTDFNLVNKKIDKAQVKEVLEKEREEGIIILKNVLFGDDKNER